MKKVLYLTPLVILFFCTSPRPVIASTGQLDLAQSVTEPVSQASYVKVYVRRFSLPSALNVTGVSGLIKLTSGLPYIAQGAFAVWYNTNGDCPANGAVYDNYYQIRSIPGTASLFWMNTISSKLGTVQVPANFNFSTKRQISGCGFMTFDLSAQPNTSSASTGLTLASQVILHYDTDSAVTPVPFMISIGPEICFGSTMGCTRATTCTDDSCAFMQVTPITTPTYLWNLFGDVNAGVFTGDPYPNPPTGAWSAGEDTYVYRNCSLPKGLSGPANYYNQIPSDAIPILNVPMQSHGSEDLTIPVSKTFSPMLLSPGDCIINLTKFSSVDGGATVNTAVYALLQATPVTGALDSVDCTSFNGWAGNTNSPNTAIDVHFYADGVGPDHFIGFTTANTTREKTVCDALGSTQSPCNHGFVFNTPLSLKDGKSHIIDMYGIDGHDNPKLQGSGKTMTCTESIPGDLTGDTHVTDADYQLFKADFGKTGIGLKADFDGSGTVDIFDYNLLVGKFGT